MRSQTLIGRLPRPGGQSLGHALSKSTLRVMSALLNRDPDVAVHMGSPRSWGACALASSSVMHDFNEPVCMAVKNQLMRSVRS